ncbi:MAG: hypothetical protein ACP5HQ_08055 [Thermoprotei archaeon]
MVGPGRTERPFVKRTLDISWRESLRVMLTNDELRRELRDVRNNVGPTAETAQVFFLAGLLKARSSKAVHRLLRAVAPSMRLSGITTLEDGTSAEEARKAYEELPRGVGW